MNEPLKVYKITDRQREMISLLNENELILYGQIYSYILVTGAYQMGESIIDNIDFVLESMAIAYPWVFDLWQSKGYIVGIENE